MVVVGCLIIVGVINGVFFFVGLIWFVFGLGIMFVIWFFFNSLVEEYYVGIVNILVGFMENVGMMVVGFFLVKSFSFGFELGGFWVGFLFIMVGMFIVIFMVILWIFWLLRWLLLVDLRV